MTVKPVKVAIVGAGAAGITAAIGLARQGIEVVVIEGAPHPGAENWSGSVYFCENLARPEILGEELLAQTPIERRVTQRGVLISDGRLAVGASVKSPDAFEHCYTVLRPVFDHDLALKARMFGAEILSGTQALGLLRHGDRVHGVLTDRGPIHADVVFLAEGDASNLVGREGLEQKPADADGQVRPEFLQGIKEVLTLPKGEIERRFGIGSEEGACFEILLRNGHVNGRDVPLNAGTFLYTNRDSISLGIVAPLHNLEQFPGGHNQLMEWLKATGPLRPLLEGAKTVSFGTKLIRGGGFREMPRWTLDGLAVGGAAAGFGVDFPCPNYTGPATFCGFAFSQAVGRIAAAGGSFDQAALDTEYSQALRDSHYFADSQNLAAWPAFVSENREFFGRQVDLVGGTTHLLTAADQHPIGRHIQAARWLWRKLPPSKLPAFVKEMTRAKLALGVHHGFLKELPACLGWSLLNLVRGWWPRRNALGATFIPHFWDDGQTKRRSAPCSVRWMRWRMGPGIAAALHQLYLNDGTPLRARMPRIQRAMLSRLSLLDLIALPLVLVGNVLLGATLAAWTKLLERTSKPTHEERARDPLATLEREGHEATDYGRAKEATSHDQKLALISYENDERTHIHFHAAYDDKGLPTFGRSPLFSVCPAKVYQAEVDQTRNTAVAVLHENCVRCETCWRADDAHVDWGRTRGQKLVYEAYSTSDAWVHESREAAALARNDREFHDPQAPSTSSSTIDLAPAVAAEAIVALEALQNHRRAFLTLSRELGSLLLGADQQLLRGLAEQVLSSAQRLASCLQAEAKLRSLTQSLDAWSQLARTRISAKRFFHFEADLLVLEAVHFEELRELTGLEPPLRAPAPVGNQEARAQLRSRLESTLDRDVLAHEEEQLSPHLLSRALLLELSGTITTDPSQRDPILEELARLSPGLAVALVAHQTALEHLRDFPAEVAPDGTTVYGFVEGPLKVHGEDLCDAPARAALVGGVDRIVWLASSSQAFLFDAASSDVQLHLIGGQGLRAAGPGRIELVGAQALARGGARPDVLETRDWDLVAIIRGMARYLSERALDHAAGRVQFPGMFRDLRGRDGIAKFGAVQDMLAGIATGLELLEELGARDGSSRTGLALAIDVLAPSPRSIAYLAGQVLGGTAYSEEDPVCRFFRDASAMTRLPVAHGALLSTLGHDWLQGFRNLNPKDAPLAPSAEGSGEHPASDLIAELLKPVNEAWTTLCANLIEIDLETRGALARDLGRALAQVEGVRRLGVRNLRHLGEYGLDPVAHAALAFHARRVTRRLERLARRVPDTADLVELGALALVPGTSEGGVGAQGADYADFRAQEDAYVSGELFVRTKPSDHLVFSPELQSADAELSEFESSVRDELIKRFRQPQFEGRRYSRHVEALHHIPLEDVRYLLDRGFFRMITPEAYGGLQEWKAKYYILCSQMMRQSDPTQAIIIMGSTSIGTTPILIGLKDDLPAARKALAKLLAKPEEVAALREGLKRFAADCERQLPSDLSQQGQALATDFRRRFEKSKAVRLVFQDVASAMGKLRKLLKTDQAAAAAKTALKAHKLLGEWEARATTESKSLEAREAAHAFYLRQIAAGRISAFGLTEPSAGSDTARIRTRAQRAEVPLNPKPAGYFEFASPRDGSLRTLFPYDRLEFEAGALHFRDAQDRLHAVQVQDFSHEETTGNARFRFVELNGQRIAIDDIGRPVERDGHWSYPHFQVEGAKMWITNASVSGVMILYARTDRGLTAFMLDSHAEGLTIGRDEHKMGQRGSATNELSLDGVRIPIDQIIGIEGRGQENALETLNVGRAGLAACSSAIMQEILQDLAQAAQQREFSPEDRLELGKIAIDLTGSEALAYQLLSRSDHPDTKSVRMESAAAKAEATEALHRVLTRAERILGPEWVLDDREFEKRRRDARVLTIYEGTNEIQRFLLLRDLVDGLDLDRVQSAADDRESAELAGLRASIDQIRERLVATLRTVRASHGSNLWQRVEWQPEVFALVDQFVDLATVTASFQRLNVAHRLLDADLPDAQSRLEWLERSLRLRVTDLDRRAEMACAGLERQLSAFAEGHEAWSQVLADRALERHTGAEEQVAHEAGSSLERPLQVALFIDPVAALAPEPRVLGGQLRELRHRLHDEERGALAQIAAWRRAGQVHVTALVVGSSAAIDVAEEVLALGADAAFLLDTGAENLLAADVVEQATELLRAREAVTDREFDLVLGRASGSSLLLPFARRLGWQPLLPVTSVRAHTPEAGPLRIEAQVEDRAAPVQLQGRLVLGLARPISESEFTFSTTDWDRARRQRIPVIEYRPEDRPAVQLGTGESEASAGSASDDGPVDFDTAVAQLASASGLSAGAQTERRFEGELGESSWPGWLRGCTSLAIVEARGSDAPPSLSIASRALRTSLGDTGAAGLLILCDQDPSEDTLRAWMGELVEDRGLSVAVLAREELARVSWISRAGFLERLLSDFSGAIFAGPELRLAALSAAEGLHLQRPDLIVLDEVDRIEATRDHLHLSGPRHDAKLRVQMKGIARDHPIMAVLRADLEATPSEAGSAAPLQVARVQPEVSLESSTDALARLIGEAAEKDGISLADAEFIITVGYGVGSQDGIEEVILPLQRVLEDLGVPRVTIGATRKVTQDLGLLTDEHQIGQTGTAVNPKIMIAVGVSGAPQHLEYIGQRALIFAFNKDADAPLLTLNQSRPRPRVVPIVGDLFREVPRFAEALKQLLAMS